MNEYASPLNFRLASAAPVPNPCIDRMVNATAVAVRAMKGQRFRLGQVPR